MIREMIEEAKIHFENRNRAWAYYLVNVIFEKNPNKIVTWAYKILSKHISDDVAIRNLNTTRLLFKNSKLDELYSFSDELWFSSNPYGKAISRLASSAYTAKSLNDLESSALYAAMAVEQLAKINRLSNIDLIIHITEKYCE